MIATPRLLLRTWRDDDLEPFAAMNADPRVMQHFPKALTRPESDRLAGLIRAHLERHGYGLWAVEIPDVVPFIGFVGLTHIPFEAHFTPAIEIGWRLAADHHGRGYATEAAHAVVEHAFGTLGIEEIVSMTTPANTASIRVMEKLGMTHDPRDDFDHPKLPQGHPLRRHVLYRTAPWPSSGA